MGKSIVMTGASSGFGAVTARALDVGAIAVSAALMMANRFVAGGASTGATNGVDLIPPPGSPRLAVGVRARRTARLVVTVWAQVIGAGLSRLRHRVTHPMQPAVSDGPERLRRTLERLGPTFVKAGQLAASRPDLLPDAYRAELATLRDHVRPLEPAVVLNLLEGAYGPDLAAVFDDVSAKPIASGSIGQVHRGTIDEGRLVAIKVRRPGVDRLVEADLSLLASGARIIDKVLRSWRQFQLPRLVQEFAVVLREELDYRHEAQQAPIIAAELAGFPEVTVPEIVKDLSGDDVIVMDLIEGVPLTDLDAINAAGLDRHELARIVLRTNLTMILFDDRFHADPHAGNYLALPDGRLGILDFGQVGVSHSSTRQQLLQLLGALVAGEPEGAAAALVVICGRPAADLTALGSDLAQLLRGLFTVTLGEISVASLLRGTLNLLGKHQLVLPAELALLLKAVFESEATAQELDPGIQLSEVIDGFFARPAATTTAALVA
jgi:ubiquinone biosynthesis protein